MPIPPAKNASKLIVLGIVLLLIVLSYLLLKPFLITLISAAVLAYLCYPVYTFLAKKTHRESMAAGIVIVALLFLVALPVYYIINGLYNETRLLLQNHPYASLMELFSPTLSSWITEGMKKMLAFFATKASEFIFALPSLFLNVIVFIASLFYFFKEGPQMLDKLESVLPLGKKEQQLFHREFSGVASGVMYGTILTGLIEGILGALGFYLFGISSPILWGLIMFILTIIPGAGTPLVWGPAGIIKIIQGNLFAGIGILIYGILLTVVVEFFLKNKIIVHKSRVHPLLVLLGVFGGLKLFGFVGLIIGPLLLGLLLPFIQGFLSQRKRHL